MSSNRERGDRVKLGHVKRLTTQAGSDWFVGNLGQATKIVILPARRKNDDGEWETVPDQFDVFLEAKTEEQIAKDKAYWDSRRGNVSNSKPAGDGGLKPIDGQAASKKPAPGSSSLHKGGMPADEIPFSWAPVLAIAATLGLVLDYYLGWGVL